MVEESSEQPLDHGQAYWRAPAVIPGMTMSDDVVGITNDFAALAEYLPTLCWIARGDGYIVWYNRRWHDYCGTSAEQMEGWGWTAVHDPDRLPEVVRRWEAAIEDGAPFEMVFPLRGADGIYRPFLTRIVPVRNADKQIVRWLGVNTEIGAQIQAEAALAMSEAKLEALTDAMPQMVWSTLPNGYHDYYNAQWYRFTGVPTGSTDGEAWNGMFHPEDQDRAWERWRKSLASGEPYEIEYRLRHHSGEYRWVLGRALPVRSGSGEIIRWIGTCTDIHEAKMTAERNELLSRELSHRIKNIFAVISGLVNLTGRRAGELRPLTNELLGRIAALGRAHEFARPHSPRSKPDLGQSSLLGLMNELLKPYDADGRIRIHGTDAVIDDKGATPIALVIHELATNAAKYGALSVPSGSLDVEVGQDHDFVTIVWTEAGGPRVAGEPTRQGFGTQLSELSVQRQLGGIILKQWRSEGLRVEIRVEPTQLHRGVQP